MAKPRFFQKGDNFATACLLLLMVESLQKRGLLLKERIYSYRSKFFSLNVDPHLEEIKKCQSRFSGKFINTPVTGESCNECI